MSERGQTPISAIFSKAAFDAELRKRDLRYRHLRMCEMSMSVPLQWRQLAVSWAVLGRAQQQAQGGGYRPSFEQAVGLDDLPKSFPTWTTLWTCSSLFSTCEIASGAPCPGLGFLFHKGFDEQEWVQKRPPRQSGGWTVGLDHRAGAYVGWLKEAERSGFVQT